MKKTLFGIASGALAIALVLTFAVSSVSAADITTKRDCEAAGGTYTNDKGVKSCTSEDEWTVEPQTGQNEQWGGSGTTTESESQKGAIGSPGTVDTYVESDDSTIEACFNPAGQEMEPNGQGEWNPNCPTGD